MHTPDNITKLGADEIFVFGSNEAGRHGRGAALTAAKKFGARYGQGDGLQGQSYGISTKDKSLRILSLDQIAIKINRFIKFATENPKFKFFVTEIGCGLAGYKVKEIASLFNKNVIPNNVILPERFCK